MTGGLESESVQPPASLRGHLGSTLWFATLVASICLEGLGRKIAPQVPAIAFYFLKDVVLIAGLVAFGVRGEVVAVGARLYGGFWVPLLLAFAWTAIEAWNPAQPSLVLALVGLRAYWLWWLAPFVVASALRDSRDRQKAVVVLAGMSAVVAAYAAMQFAAPPDSSVNAYATYQGKEVLDVVATVESTQRVRVSSTFAYITGFTDFVVIVPALLLSLGLGEPHRTTRIASLVGAGLSAAVMPMSGSRSPVVLGVLALTCVIWCSGHIRSQSGRRVLLAGIALLAVSLLVAPDAIKGVQDRFGYEDTEGRFRDALLSFVPPLTMAEIRHPPLGLGTGMQQNSRFIFSVGDDRWPLLDLEQGRLLVELGPGYLFVWVARLGLAVAFLRASRLLYRAKRRELAGASVAFAILTMQGNLVFDHVWQALYFLAAGLVLQALVEVQTELAPEEEVVPASGLLADQN